MIMNGDVLSATTTAAMETHYGSDMMLIPSSSSASSAYFHYGGQGNEYRRTPALDALTQTDSKHGNYQKLGVSSSSTSRKRQLSPREEEEPIVLTPKETGTSFEIEWHELSNSVKEGNLHAISDRCCLAVCEAPGESGGILACSGFGDDVIHSFQDMFRLDLSSLEWELMQTSLEERCFSHCAMFAVNISSQLPKRVFIIGALDIDAIESQSTGSTSKWMHHNNSITEGIEPGKYLEVWEWEMQKNSWNKRPGEPRAPFPERNENEASLARKQKEGIGATSDDYPANKTVPSAPWSREGFASVAIQKRIFVYGGLDRSGIIDKEIREARDSTEIMKAMRLDNPTTMRTPFGAFAVNHFAPSQLVYRVDKDNNLLSPTQQMNSAPTDWFCGDLWMYNVVKARWKRMRCDRGKTPTPRAFASVTVVSNPMRLILYGGLGPYKRQPLDDVNVFDLNQNVNGTWSQPTLTGSLLGPRLNGSMHTLEDNLVIVYGGRSGTTESTISSDIKLLDAKAFHVRTPSVTGGLPAARESHGFVVLKNPGRYSRIKELMSSADASHFKGFHSCDWESSPYQFPSCILVLGGRASNAGRQTAESSGTHLIVLHRHKTCEQKKRALGDNSATREGVHIKRRALASSYGSSMNVDNLDSNGNSLVHHGELAANTEELLSHETMFTRLQETLSEKLEPMEQRLNDQVDSVLRNLQKHIGDAMEARVWKGEAEQLKENKERLEAKLQSLEAQLRNEQGRREGLERENSSLSTKLQSVEDAHRREYEVNALSHVEARHANKQLRAKEEELSEARKEIRNLQQKTCDLSEALHEESSKRKSLAEELFTLKQTLRQISGTDSHPPNNGTTTGTSTSSHSASFA